VVREASDADGAAANRHVIGVHFDARPSDDHDAATADIGIEGEQGLGDGLVGSSLTLPDPRTSIRCGRAHWPSRAVLRPVNPDEFLRLGTAGWPDGRWWQVGVSTPNKL
jgi:hypothetical protein